MNDRVFTRRAFLDKGLTIISMAVTVPCFLQRSAFSLANPFDILLTSSIAGVPDDRILVVVQLGGGNDGLNCVVPYGNDLYYKFRPNLGIQPQKVLKVNEAPGLGFHPNLTGLKELHDQGLLATVQGVGYPNPNRSHFTSTDIWQSADPSNPAGNGWLGRYFDNECNGTPKPNVSIAIGRSAPKALQGVLNKPISFESAKFFRWIGQDNDQALKKHYDQITHGNKIGTGTAAANLPASDPDSQLDFLTRTTLDAQLASQRIRQAVAQPPLVKYPNNALAGQLRMVAAMIRAGLPTRVYYVTLGGFDTHAGQSGRHANLLNQLGSSLLAFQNELNKQGNDDRVLTMTFSEFGRRVSQNASQGTDHGTAAPMWLMGPMVQPGFIGRHPALSNLDQGDLKFQIDFRSVYAAVLENWFKTDSTKVLPGKYRKPAAVLRDSV